MTINPGMLLFGLIDSFTASFLVYSVSKAKLGGNKKIIARTVGAVLGTIVFVIYLGLIIWFNTQPYTLPSAAKNVIYVAPFVLSALILTLVLLSQPPKKEKEAESETENETIKAEQEKQETQEEAI